MSDRVFFDTNLLVYAFDADDPAKQVLAARIVAEGLRSSAAVISAQVLGEFLSRLRAR